MASPTPSWSVQHQEPTTGQNSAGRYVTGTRVYIQTAMGHKGSAFIPDDQYSPEKVKPVLAALAARLDGVGSLSG